MDVKVGITEEEKLRHCQKKVNLNFSHLKTLVVDDDVAVCESAVATLGEMGVKAEWVDSGRKAVERVKTLWKQKKYYKDVYKRQVLPRGGHPCPGPCPNRRRAVHFLYAMRRCVSAKSTWAESGPAPRCAANAEKGLHRAKTERAVSWQDLKSGPRRRV